MVLFATQRNQKVNMEIKQHLSWPKLAKNEHHLTQLHSASLPDRCENATIELFWKQDFTKGSAWMPPQTKHRAQAHKQSYHSAFRKKKKAFSKQKESVNDI